MKSFKAGVFVNQGYYRSFQPAPINREWQGGKVIDYPFPGKSKNFETTGVLPV
jgi:hypothetical protein